MTKNERELINLIREHNNPEQALIIAIETLSKFIENK